MNLTTIISSVLPLVTISGGGWCDTYFTQIRHTCVANSGIVVSLAMTLGCIFVAFKFIKMYYDFVSDEQHGGFGGVRAWDLFRPIVILIFIWSFGTWSNMLDSICGSISSSLVSNMNATYNASTDKISKRINDLEADRKKKYTSDRQRARDMALSHMNITQAELTDANKTLAEYAKNYKPKSDFWTKLSIALTAGESGAAAANLAQAVESDNLNTLEDNLRKANLLEDYNRKKSLVEEFNSIVPEEMKRIETEKKWERYFGSGKSFWGNLAGYAFNIFFVIMMAFCDIMLCILLVFGPLSLALSLLDPWKSSFKSWLGKYIEVSMWKPIASAIAWVVMQGKASVASFQLGSLDRAGSNLSIPVQEGHLAAAISFQILIFVAGVIAVLKTPEIANSILSLGSAATGKSGDAAGGAMAAAAQPAINAGKAGLNAGGTVAGSTLKGAVANGLSGVRTGFLNGIRKIGL